MYYSNLLNMKHVCMNKLLFIVWNQHGQEVSFNIAYGGLKNLLIIEIQHQFKLSLVILIKSMISLQFVEQDNC